MLSIQGDSTEGPAVVDFGNIRTVSAVAEGLHPGKTETSYLSRVAWAEGMNQWGAQEEAQGLDVEAHREHEVEYIPEG